MVLFASEIDGGQFEDIRQVWRRFTPPVVILREQEAASAAVIFSSLDCGLTSIFILERQTKTVW